MKKSHVKITISIPVELNNVIDTLVAESKKSAQPLSKSKLFSVSAYEYLVRAKMILDSQNSKKEEIN